MKSIICILILIFGSQKNFAGQVHKKAQDNLVIHVVGYIKLADKKPRLNSACFAERNRFIEAVYVNKPVYKVISLSDSGEIGETRQLDFHTYPVTKDDGDLKGNDGTSFLIIQMKYSKKIKKIQLLKDSKVLDETDVVSLKKCNELFRSNSIEYLL